MAEPYKQQLKLAGGTVPFEPKALERLVAASVFDKRIFPRRDTPLDRISRLAPPIAKGTRGAMRPPPAKMPAGALTPLRMDRRQVSMDAIDVLSSKFSRR